MNELNGCDQERVAPTSTATVASAKTPHIDRDYETLRIGVQTLFDDLGIRPIAATAA